MPGWVQQLLKSLTGGVQSEMFFGGSNKTRPPIRMANPVPSGTTKECQNVWRGFLAESSLLQTSQEPFSGFGWLDRKTDSNRVGNHYFCRRYYVRPDLWESPFLPHRRRILHKCCRTGVESSSSGCWHDCAWVLASLNRPKATTKGLA